MSHARRSFAALLAVCAIIVSCTDRPTPTESVRQLGRGTKSAAGTCTTIPQLKSLATTVFGSRNEYLHDAIDNISDIGEYVAENHLSDAQKKATWLISYIQQHASTFANPGQAQTLIGGIMCYVGLSSDSFLIYPTDQTQTIVSTDGQAGIQLPANPVSQPTLITVTILPPGSPPPLITKLDQYPGYVVVTQLSGVSNSLTVPVTVAVCPAAGIPDSIRNRLRLGHQATAGFEVTPAADGSFLNCSSIASSGSALPGWLRALASVVLPKPLYARMRASGGIGGTATEFSPFGPVDPVLSFSGGIGGTATEFQRAPASPFDTTSPSTTSAVRKTTQVKSSVEIAKQLAPVIDCGSAPVGSALAAECRPRITLTTLKGTILQNVPVTWAIGQGGGQTAMDSSVSRTCGLFGSTASTTTNVNGKAGACWTLGAIAGINTLIATPQSGGDVPSGVTFVPASDTFTVTAVKNTATLSLGGLTQTYDGTAKSVTVTTTPLGLNTVAVTYNGSATPPITGGSYSVVATLNNPSYSGMVSGTFVIAQAAQAALSVTGPSTATFGDAPVQLATSGGTGTGAVTFASAGSTACSVTTGGLLSITSGTGTCIITATNAGDTNYAPVTSGAFSVTVSKAPQAALSITGPTTIAFGGSTVALGTTGGSGTGAVTFSAGASTACSTTTDGTVTATHGSGPCMISASKAMDDNYLAGAPATTTLAVTKAAAIITLSNLAQTFDGSPKSLTATTTPVGLTDVSVSYGSSPTPPTAAGSYAVVAHLTNADYVATDATGTLVISKAAQITLSVTGPSTATFGDAPLQLGTSGGSGNGGVTFAASGSTACSVSTGGLLTVTSGTGTCAITATKADDGNYAVATSAALSIAINKASITIVLGTLSATYDGSTKSVTASTTPALAGIVVTYNGSTSPPVNAGSYGIAATLSDANYAAATATGTLVINKANQPALTMSGPSTATYGAGTVLVSATGGAGTGNVTFDASSTPAACSVNAISGQVSMLSGVGPCVVTGARAGDGNYNAGAVATLSIALSKASQSISFAALSAMTYGDPSFSISATSSAALPVTLTVAPGSACALSGGTVALTNAGACAIIASQGGDASYYLPATPVTQSFSIAKRAATATAGSGSMSVGGAVPSLPCTVTGLLATDAGAVTCTTNVPSTPVSGANTTTPIVTPSNPANYAMLLVNGTLTLNGYGQQNCFASPVSSGLTPPPTSVALKQGTKVTVSCRLVDGNGHAVATAKGSLVVQDRGTNGLTVPGATVFSGTNVFTVHDDGDNSADDGVYSYVLSTSTAGFIKGHYYFLTATWSDGSTTKGWIYLKP
jgi:hypothetical protein